MSWDMTVMLFCSVGIVWMAIAMPYSRGWRYLNVRMEDSLLRSSAVLQQHALPEDAAGADDGAMAAAEYATR